MTEQNLTGIPVIPAQVQQMITMIGALLNSHGRDLVHAAIANKAAIVPQLSEMVEADPTGFLNLCLEALPLPAMDANDLRQAASMLVAAANALRAAATDEERAALRAGG